MCVVQLFIYSTVYVSVCMYVSTGGGEEEEEKRSRRKGGGEEEAFIHLIHLKASFYYMTSHSLTLDIA